MSSPFPVISHPVSAAQSVIRPFGRHAAPSSAQVFRWRVGAALTYLAEELAALTPETEACFLSAYVGLRAYSPGNRRRMRAQRQEARWVTGQKAWAKAGFAVRAGEQPIRLRAPDPPHGYKDVSVFDLAQVERVAGTDVTRPVAWSSVDEEALAARLTERARDAGITVSERLLTHGMMGYSELGEIVLDPMLEPARRTSVLLHELVHEVLHGEEARAGKDKRLIELEAEATAFVVSALLGRHQPMSGTYLHGYGNTGVDLANAMAAICDGTRGVLRIVEPSLLHS